MIELVKPSFWHGIIQLQILTKKANSKVVPNARDEILASLATWLDIVDVTGVVVVLMMVCGRFNQLTGGID